MVLSCLVRQVVAALFPVRVQAVKQSAVAGAGRRRLVQDDNVQARYFALLLPERLPDDALYSVPASREATVLLADREPESWLVCAVWSVKNRKHFVAAAVSFVKYATEGGFVGKPASTSEAAVHVGTFCALVFRSYCGRKLARPTA